MNRMAERIMGRFHDRLGQGGMGMHDPHERLRRGFVLESHAGLGDQVGGPRPDNVNTQQLIVSRLGDDFDESVTLIQDAGFAVGTEREATAYDARCRQIAIEMLYLFSRVT